MKLVHLTRMMRMRATGDAPIETGPMPIATRRVFHATGDPFEGECSKGEVLLPRSGGIMDFSEVVVEEGMHPNCVKYAIYEVTHG